jgi:hypothetical protein
MKGDIEDDGNGDHGAVAANEHGDSVNSWQKGVNHDTSL